MSGQGRQLRCVLRWPARDRRPHGRRRRRRPAGGVDLPGDRYSRSLLAAARSRRWLGDCVMTQTITPSGGLHSGNPALSEKFVETQPASRATRSGCRSPGVSVKTLVLLVVLVAGGAWGWASATKPVGVDLGSGYANTTVTIPGGFWLASFGAFLLGIFIVVQPASRRRCSVCSTRCARASASERSRRCSTRRPRASSAPRSCRRCACSSSPLFLYVTRIIKPTQKLAFAVVAGHRRARAALLLRVHPVDLQLGLAVQRQLPHRSASSSR